MTKILDFLQGKKTYIVMTAMVLYAVIGFVLKYMTFEDASKMVLDALAIGGFRSALNKMQ